MKSLAARIHEWLGGKATRTEFKMAAYAQHQLFGIILSKKDPADFTITHQPDHTIRIDWVPPGTANEEDRRQTLMLRELVSRFEDEEDPDRYEDESPYTVDCYRTFPRDLSAIVTVSNPTVGRSEDVFGMSLSGAKNTLAQYHGYASWAEMMSFAPPSVKEEDWHVVWACGSPDENRREALEREARDKALATLAGEIGIEAPEISRVSWLKTLLDEIDATPGIKELLERDDPSAMTTMLRECRELADEGMAALELLRPKFPFEIIEKPAATEAHQ